VPPRTLARSSQLRLTAVSLTGLLAGFLGGLLAIYLVGSFVAVAGSAEAPLPPIRPVVSWLAVVVVTAAVAVFGVGATIILARRELRRTTGMRLRD
jgi:ABC-type antimicrobial peptide transport system permease subunit